MEVPHLQQKLRTRDDVGGREMVRGVGACVNLTATQQPEREGHVRDARTK